MNSKWSTQTWVIISSLYLLAFITSTIQVFTLRLDYRLFITAPALVITLGVFTLARMVYSYYWRRDNFQGGTVLAIDFILGALLVFSTGGLFSSFLIYTFLPVIVAGLLFNARVTVGITSLTALYIGLGYSWNPFLLPSITSDMVSGRLLYFLPLLLVVAVLPYLVNIGLRKRLELRGVLQERRRLSRNLHDGIAQLVYILHWHTRSVNHRLAQMNIDLEEVRQLTKVSERLHTEIRSSLKLLRSGNGAESPVSPPRVEGAAAARGRAGEIDIFQPEAVVEAQLLYICREALANIRKHSSAHEINIKIQSHEGVFKLVVADDGCGFDSDRYARNWLDGHGLQVMRERAESIGGKLSVESVPRKGTVVRVEIPLKNKVTSDLL